ncbi:MAG: Arc family DNA-binding protein [Lentisphaeria bacterium]|nr:Arc family DNA-binding protein [Lentisphaeria bacterium]
MPTITLKNVPPTLHRRLKEQAGRHFRSLNSEILARLTASLDGGMSEPEVLARAKAWRTRLAERGVWVTEGDIREARDAGRP